MDYQKIILVGNATKDAKEQQSKDGEVSFTTFSMGVGESKDKTTFFPVVAFGKLGEKVASLIVKGHQVVVDGRIDVNEKGYFNVVASRIRLGSTPNLSQAEKKTE
jgi:single-stranded DNA-binding protein